MWNGAMTMFWEKFIGFICVEKNIKTENGLNTHHKIWEENKIKSKECTRK